MDTPELHPDTVAVHAGRDDLAELGAHAPPIDLSSTYALPSVGAGGDSYEAMATGGHPLADGGMVYQRLWNPTVARFERALAELEGAEGAVAFGSGMAAVTATLLAFTAATGRRHVVAVRPLYGGTDHLLESGLLGTEVTFCGQHEVGASVRPDTGLVMLETPANPTLDLVDIAAVAAQAGSVPVLVDSTFATPVLQQPLRWGAAMVLHSATKYLGGHGDVVGGVVACDEQTAAALRRVRAVTGALMHPLSAYLLQRGLTTLPTRMRAQQASAERLAAWLSEHPDVTRVHYPGRCEDTGGALDQQMTGGGAMVSIELRGGYAAASRMIETLRVFTHAVSLGGVDSLAQHPAALTHRPVAPSARPDPGLVRLSIGLEAVEDLRADLGQALHEATRPTAVSSAVGT